MKTSSFLTGVPFRCVNVIHTTVVGRVPPDLAGVPFDDPRFSQRLTQFLVDFANRYHDRLGARRLGRDGMSDAWDADDGRIG